MDTRTATVDVDISASPHQVWQALTEPEQIRSYMFGAEVETSWQPGDPIVWRGEYDGRPFEDRGEVLEVEPDQRLVLTHFSPLTGRPDAPENYHRVSWALDESGDHTRVALEQTLVADETAEQAEENWTNVLRQLKEHVERG
ncbi:MAG TPA: SRPBCC domain-containing protein [Nocardioides sp.]|nr:SRPBCC domain-containing protein [Nocardioides sp.]